MGKHISVRVGDDLERRIAEEKRKYPYDVPTSEIVRVALEEYLAGNVRAEVEVPA